MKTKSQMIMAIAELSEQNTELRKYIEKMDKPEIKTIDAEVAMENIRLKQCLQEIKEIAEIIYNTNCNYISEAGKIIKKVREVLDERQV